MACLKLRRARHLALVCSLSAAMLPSCGGEATTGGQQAGGSGASAGAGGAGGTAEDAASGGSAGDGGSGGAAGAAGSGGAAGQAGSGGSSPGFEPDPACNYLDSSQLAISCDSHWTTGLAMTSSIGGTKCPDYVQVGSAAVIDSAALEALGCDPSCVYVAATAALFVYCGAKGELTDFVDGGPLQTGPAGSCPALGHYDSVAGSGWYSSWEEFQAANPCP